MNKLITAFGFLFLIGTLLSAVMEGGGGMNATRLTADHTAAAVVLNVTSTEGFLKSDIVNTGNEQIKYTNKTATTFTGCTRAYNGTTATIHSLGEKVYSQGASVLNSALGFNVAATGASVGVISIPITLVKFVTTTLPRFVTWDYSWLKTSEATNMLRLALSFFSIGFTVYMAYMIASMLGGVMQSIWR